MKKTVKPIDSLKDSRILFDKEPPSFGYMLIIIMEVLLFLAFLWAALTPKIYTIQAQGTVTTDDANYVMASYSGEIRNCSLEEGALVEKGDILFTVKSTDYDLQETQLVSTKEVYEKQIAYNERLIQCIKNDKNDFDESDPEESLYYNSFERYKSKVEQCKVNTSEYVLYGYTQDEIKKELVKNQSKIDELYYTEIQSAESAIEQAKGQIASLDAQLSAVGDGQAAHAVKATASGVLHLMDNYKSGMVVQAAAPVAMISPENTARVIESYVPAADMARMGEGDAVQIVVDGLSQSVYGTLSGTVRQIDSNVTTRQGGDGSTVQMFKVLIDMESDYLVGNGGEVVKLTNGMSTTARIQYDKETYLDYILNKLGFKAK